MFEQKIQRLAIPSYPFKRIMEINQVNLNELFPERAKIKGVSAGTCLASAVSVESSLQTTPIYVPDLSGL
jgi:hypothetical protein